MSLATKDAIVDAITDPMAEDSDLFALSVGALAIEAGVQFTIRRTGDRRLHIRMRFQDGMCRHGCGDTLYQAYTAAMDGGNTR